LTHPLSQNRSREFDVNPLVMESNGTRTVKLTLHAAENATTGAYSMDVVITDYPSTFTFATNLGLTVTVTEQRAVEKGRDFLDSRNYTTGRALITEVEEKAPNLTGNERLVWKTQTIGPSALPGCPV
jgi:hypothetical protein